METYAKSNVMFLPLMDTMNVQRTALYNQLILVCQKVTVFQLTFKCDIAVAICFVLFVFFCWCFDCDLDLYNTKYSPLSLSRIPRDSLRHFEIPVPRHIRVAKMRKTIN